MRLFRMADEPPGTSNMLSLVFKVSSFEYFVNVLKTRPNAVNEAVHINWVSITNNIAVHTVGISSITDSEAVVNDWAKTSHQDSGTLHGTR